MPRTDCADQHILHKLKKSKLYAVTDDVFPKAYFAMAVKVKELHQEIKGFLNDSNLTYNEILEKIHTDYCTQTMGGHI